MAAALDTKAVTVADLLDDFRGDFSAAEISDLVLDSRDVRPGAAFIALAGERTHGLEFARQALADGAAVVLFDPHEAAPERSETPPGRAVPVSGLRSRLGELARRFYAGAATRTTVTGVTGTNGKTTVTWLLAEALTQAGRTSGYIGTLGFGIVPQLSEHRLTTPDCLTLHREIALMPVSDVALEVSSIGLIQDRLAGIDVSGAVFTNLTHDHLDVHGSLEAYAQAKAQLFARAELEHAVVNIDDAYAGVMLAATRADVRILTVSVEGHREADLCGTIRRHSLDGMSLRVSGAYGEAVLDTALIGRFNAMNLLCALGAMLNLDIPFEEACECLSQAAAPPGRMERFGGGDRAHIVVDYAHSPDALARVLATLRELAPGRLICVFGCGGDRDASKRAAMGAAAGRADFVVLTDDNPRGENPGEIIAGIMVGLSEHADVVVEHDRGRAIDLAIESSAAGDVVLIAGRGHERLQLRRGAAVEFDDRDRVAQTLRIGA